MKILFIHQDVPGQFKHLASRLGADPDHRVVFIGRRPDPGIAGVRALRYQPRRAANPTTHPYLRSTEDAVLHGQEVARLCLWLQRGGFTPDIIVAHPGWGESLFVKEVFPSVPLLAYAEFFYRPIGADVNFAGGDTLDLDEICRLRIRTAPLLLALEACDRAVAPTAWQKSLHPTAYHPKIEVIFDGVDSTVAAPDPNARCALPNGAVLTREDTVITFVARNLEPHRGFPSFMRALPDLLGRLPQAQVVIAGGDGISYGRAPPSGKTWRETMLEEVSIDKARVHFVGWLPYETHLALLRVSTVHVYLTVPFVLSWSFMEAMATGCLVLGSDTAPVREVVSDGENGFLVDHLAPDAIADRVADLVAARHRLGAVRQAARDTVLERYDLAKCLPRQLALIRDLAGSGG